MNIKQIEQRFNPADLLVIRRFLAWVNETTKADSGFADDASIDELNHFSEMADSDEGIKASVKEYLRLKKVRLRGNQTGN